MKKNYSRPELEVVSYNVENVITVDVSSVFGDGSNGTTAKDQVKSVSYTQIFGV